MKRAILFGATGFIGSHLLTDLLPSSDYDQVTVVVRKPLKLNHPKLKVVIGDFQTLPTLKSEIVGDEIFIALGTTRKQTPQQDDYYQVDHDYPVLAAKLAQENGATAVFIVTAIGADPASKFFYIRTKGETERDIIALNFKHTYIFQPSMIVGHRQQERALEGAFIKTWSVLDRVLIAGMDRYKGIDGKGVARAMVAAARSPSAKLKIYRWREMIELLRS